MTDQEKNYYEKLREREIKREHKRINNMQRYDEYLGNHQMKLNQLKLT